MKVTRETLEKMAHLARLDLDEAREEKLLASLNNIIEWVDKLAEVDIEGVEPLTHMSAEQNIFRKDEVKDQLPRKEALKNAPSHNGEFFKVPKVIE